MWLSRSTGKQYRLLTEAGWEYAARAGSTSRYSCGDEVGADNANCNGCGDRLRLQTVHMGSFKPNGFGLHDMHGNAWEFGRRLGGHHGRGQQQKDLGMRRSRLRRLSFRALRRFWKN
jgi:formylglycine-generating enzyme required for sulfatase activity